MKEISISIDRGEGGEEKEKEERRKKAYTLRYSLFLTKTV